jgi:hypothetical protein
MQPFLAMIVPMGGTGGSGPVDPGYSPPWARPTPPRPSNPIALPGDPWWGGGGPVDPGYGIPGGIPGTRPPIGGVDPGWGNSWFDPRPSHPIYYPPPGPVDPGYSPPWARPPLGIWGPPQMPPGFWGGGMGPGVKPQPPFPGQGGPVDPGWSGGVGEPGTRPPEGSVDPGWGVTPGRPPQQGGVPIQLPGQNPGGGWVYAYVPGYGWMWIKTAPPQATTKPNPGEKPVQPVEPSGSTEESSTS